MTEIENAFLGSILKNPKNLDSLIDVHRDWFVGQNNKLVFDAIRSLFSGGKSVDPITVISFISSTFKKDFKNHINDILSGDFNPENFDTYQEDLAEHNLKSKMIICLNESRATIEKAGHGVVKDAVDLVEGEIFKVGQLGGSTNTIYRMGDVGVGVMKQLKKIRETGAPPFMAYTGISDVDRKIGGFSAGDYIILAGATSMGKTALSLQMVRNNVSANLPVGFISLEMKKERIFLRHLSAEANIDSLRMREGKVNSVEFAAMSESWKKINSLPLIIDDSAPMTELQVRSSARRMVSLYGINLLVIDYIQKLDSYRRSENRQQEITKISGALKNLAMELSIPVVSLSQLSRKVSERNPPRPVLSDLRESGSLEADADIVLLLYRPEYYGIGSFEDGSATTGVAEIIVAKARDGETGTARSIFVKQVGKFQNLARGFDE